MPFDHSQEPRVEVGSHILILGTVYRIGHPHDLSASPPTIAPGSLWGNEVIGKKSGDIVRLVDRCEGARQPVYHRPDRIEIVNYIDPRFRTIGSSET